MCPASLLCTTINISTSKENDNHKKKTVSSRQEDGQMLSFKVVLPLSHKQNLIGKNISFLSLAGQAVMLIQAVVRLQILPRLVRGLTCNGDGIASDLHRSTFKFTEHPYEILICCINYKHY